MQRVDCACLLALILFFSISNTIAQSSVIGNPIKIGNIEVAQYDFSNRMKWGDAINICSKLGNGWRLPTKEELDLLFKNKHLIGNFKDPYLAYWSSSEVDNNIAWYEVMKDGFSRSTEKFYESGVRAVRNSSDNINSISTPNSQIMETQSLFQVPVRFNLNNDNSLGEAEYGTKEELITKLLLEQKAGKAIIRILQQDNTGNWTQKDVLSFFEPSKLHSILDVKDFNKGVNSTMDSVYIKMMPGNISKGMPDLFSVIKSIPPPFSLTHKLQFSLAIENNELVDYIKPEFSFDEKNYTKIDTFFRSESAYHDLLPNNIFLKTIQSEMEKQKAFSARIIYYRFKVVYRNDSYKYIYIEPLTMTLDNKSRYLDGKVYVLKKEVTENTIEASNTTPVFKSNPQNSKQFIEAPIIEKRKDKVVSPSITTFKSKDSLNRLSKFLDDIRKRRSVELATLKLNAENILISVYDNGTIDNDSVTIFYNGKILYDSYRLSENALQFSLHFDEQNAMNELLVVANNLGSIPPNTALLIIQVNNKRYEVFPKTDFETNSLLKIVYSPRKLGDDIKSEILPPR